MFTQPYSDRVKAAGRLLAQADFILIGAGAGLSAAGGLNYQDPDLFRKWYPQFARLGLRNIWEAIVAHWAPNDANRRRFWPSGPITSRRYATTPRRDAVSPSVAIGRRQATLRHHHER